MKLFQCQIPYANSGTSRHTSAKPNNWMYYIPHAELRNSSLGKSSYSVAAVDIPFPASVKQESLIHKTSLLYQHADWDLSQDFLFLGWRVKLSNRKLRHWGSFLGQSRHGRFHTLSKIGELAILSMIHNSMLGRHNTEEQLLSALTALVIICDHLLQFLTNESEFSK